MSIEKVRAYFEHFGIADRIREFDVSSATVELAAVAVGVEGARIAKSMSFKLADDEPIIIMTGAVRSVLGIKPEQSVETFLGGLPGRYREPEKSTGKMQGAIFTLDDATGLCVGVERVDVR